MSKDGTRGEHSRNPTPRRPVDASMGLLSDIVARALDPDYQEVARRPRERGPGEQVKRAAVLTVLATALGATLMVAVLALRTPSVSETSPRVLLEREIELRTSVGEELARANESLSAEIARLQEDALEADNPELFARLQESELVSGTAAVTGPGLVIEIDDARDLDPVDEQARVQDVDLQIVTNGLWAAGAEAIAINGQRLTGLTAIRGIGPAILVDVTPVVTPYRVEAIGDPQVMQTAFARSTAANHVAFLSGTYGISTTISAASELNLPGAGNPTLRHATRPVPAVAPSSEEKRDAP